LKLQFGSSGIRGKYPDKVNPVIARELAKRITSGFGRDIAIGYDSRSSSPALKAILLSSALENGANLKDYGFLPTPALSHETRSRGLNCGIMITASHNPPEYNGFKVFNSDGEAFDDETAFPTNNGILERNQLSTRLGRAETCAPEQYENALSGISFSRNWKVVLDPGNGAASDVAPRAYGRVLAKVTGINCIRETDFSSRGSEPTQTSMRMLCSAVAGSGADAGVGFDGDGDRMFMIDEKGICHLQDRVLAAFVASLSTRSKGPFVVPLDASMAIDEVAEARGAQLVRGPVGDAKLLREMKAVKGTFAGEPSGAWIHPQFNPCPDGILSGLLFLKAVENDGRTVSQVIEEVPEYYMIRESLPSTGTDAGKTRNIGREIEKIVGQDAKVSGKFGLRVSSDNSWVLVRASGTEPVLRITAESKIRKEAARIIQETIRILHRLMKGTD
jgi:phosphoglucosamine mutase